MNSAWMISAELSVAAIIPGAEEEVLMVSSSRIASTARCQKTRSRDAGRESVQENEEAQLTSHSSMMVVSADTQRYYD
jgi:hypothetical protein